MYKGESLRFREAFRSSTNGHVVSDDKGIILAVNPAMERIFGYTEEELMGENITILMPKKNGMEHSVYMDSYIQTGHKRIIGIGRELVAKHKDGHLFPIHLGIGELKRKRQRNFLASISDMTEITRAQAAAEEANIAKSQFLANMSHELRTPLNAVIGFSEIIKGQTISDLGEERVHEYNDIIHTAGTHLLTMINDILDISRTEVGAIKLNLTPVDLNTLLRSAINTCLVKMKENETESELVFDDNIKMGLFDSKLLTQVLINLIHNASKFTHKGKITVSAELVGGNSVCLKVNDTGIGIPEDHLERIFERFAIVDNAMSRNHGGAGLGLSLVQNLCTIMNAEVSVKSEINKGTEFTVMVPYKEA
nr:PAS domain-containing sensor histidine kinase [Pseudemcibacter aquimaris]